MKARYLSSLGLVIAVGCIVLATDNRAQPTRSPQPPASLVTSKSCSPPSSGAHESYRLPPIKGLPSKVSFATDWAHSASGGWFGIQAVDRCRMQPDGFLTWHGKVAVRVEVQPNDDPLALKSNTERAEVLMMQGTDGHPFKESKKSGRQYYATSYYFPENWRGQQLPWSAFAPTDCAARDQNQCNSWSFVWQFWGWGGLSAAQTSVGGPQRFQFNGSAFEDGGKLALGKWTDLVMMVDWTSGAYKVWRRDEGNAKFGRVLSGSTPVSEGKEIYVKQGLYRGGNVAGRTDVLWIGPTARASNFAAVEQQAFGTEDGAAED